MTSMKNFAMILGTACGAAFGAASVASAAEAQTSAAVSRGSAAATAQYSGEHGFARTDTRTGRLDLARGVAVGVDESGLSLSVSHAVRPNGGPALATTFNLAIGPGGVAGSTGIALADGPRHAQAQSSGQAATGWGAPAATASAGGATDAAGRVHVQTRSDSQRWPDARPSVVVSRRVAITPVRPVERVRIVEPKRPAGRW